MSIGMEVGLVVLVFIAYLVIMHWKTIKTHFASPSTVTPATPASGTAPATPPTWWKRIADNWWIVLPALVVGGLLWWLWPTETMSLKAPRPDKVWEFFKNYWLWIVLVLAIPFSVLFSVEETWAKAVKGVIGVAAVILTGAMIVHGIWGESSPQQEKTLIMPAGGNSERIPGLPGHRVVVDGKKDSFLVHSVYEDGRECSFIETCSDGLVVAIYVTNKDKNNPNIVTWEYARIK